jgi:hypothetical protein
VFSRKNARHRTLASFGGLVSVPVAQLSSVRDVDDGLSAEGDDKVNSALQALIDRFRGIAGHVGPDLGQ